MPGMVPGLIEDTMDSCVPLVCIMGLVGSGKTTDAIAALPNGICIGPKAGFMSVSYLGPLTLRIADISDIVKTTAMLKTLRKDKQGATGVIVDDLTVQLMNHLDEVRPQYPSEGDGVWALWRHMDQVNTDFLYAAEELGLPVIITAHVRPPDGDRRGGPSLPSKNQTEPFCKKLTHVLRAYTDEKIQATWKGRYSVRNGHPMWIEKDRYGVFAQRAPMNFAEHARFAFREGIGGYDLPRARGMEWTEEWVEYAADLAADGNRAKSVHEMLTKELPDVDPRVVRWIVRDGMDRQEIRTNWQKMVRMEM